MRSSGSYSLPDPSPGAKFREFPKACKEESHSCQSHCSTPGKAKCVEAVGLVLPESQSTAELTLGRPKEAKKLRPRERSLRGY